MFVYVFGYRFIEFYLIVIIELFLLFGLSFVVLQFGGRFVFLGIWRVLYVLVSLVVDLLVLDLIENFEVVLWFEYSFILMILEVVLYIQGFIQSFVRR